MKKLKCSDIRIGNYIRQGTDKIDPNDEGEDFGEVLSIGNEEQEFEQIYCSCSESFEWFFKDNYSGIPISEKWLKRFKFKQGKFKIANLNLKTDEFTNDILTIAKVSGNTPDWQIAVNGKYLVVFIQDVHQLQNLFFCLTGKELKIKRTYGMGLNEI